MRDHDVGARAAQQPRQPPGGAREVLRVDGDARRAVALGQRPA